MPVAIPLRFVPPTEPDVVKLHIYEGSGQTSSDYIEIDSTSNIGVYPNYIDRYVTALANSVNDWFAIQWEDSEGLLYPLSASVQGFTQTLVGEIVDRVLLRAPLLSEPVIAQEAESVIEFALAVTDPYSVDVHTIPGYKLSAITDLVIVACLYTDVVQRGASISSYSAGMVSQQSGVDTNTLDNLTKLETRALRRLGIGGSLIARIDRDSSWRKFSITAERTLINTSRLLAVTGIITNKMEWQDIS